MIKESKHTTKPTTIMSLPNTVTLNEIKAHANENNNNSVLEHSVLEIAFGGRDNIPQPEGNSWNYRTDMMNTRGYYGRYAGVVFFHDQVHDSRPWRRAVKFSENLGTKTLDLQKVRDKWNELIEFNAEFTAEKEAIQQARAVAEQKNNSVKDQTVEAFGDKIQHYSNNPAEAFKYSKDARLQGENIEGRVTTKRETVNLKFNDLTPEQAAKVFEMVDEMVGKES